MFHTLLLVAWVADPRMYRPVATGVCVGLLGSVAVGALLSVRAQLEEPGGRGRGVGCLFCFCNEAKVDG